MLRPRKKLQTSASHPTSSTSSQQQNSLNSTISSPSTSKEKDSQWITIINLILTAIIGIGGIVEAIYLNKQNEQSQIKIVQLQSDIQRNNSFAHLQIQNISPYDACFTFCVFNITNTGPATASDVNIIVTLTNVTNYWQPFTKDITMFRIETSRPSLVKSINYVSSNQLFSSVHGENAFEINIPNLPPGEAIEFIPIDKIQTVKSQLSSLIRIHLAQDEENLSRDQIISSIQPLINDYFTKKLVNLSFVIDVTCVNCEANSNYGTSYKTSLDLSSFEGIQYNIQNVVPYKKSYEIVLNPLIDYLKPKVANSLSFPSSLELEESTEQPYSLNQQGKLVAQQPIKILIDCKNFQCEQ